MYVYRACPKTMVETLVAKHFKVNKKVIRHIYIYIVKEIMSKVIILKVNLFLKKIYVVKILDKN